MDKGWAINLSGGYHHAKKNSGEGFCYFSDVALAIYHLWEKDSTLKILFIDLDAHQGNGIATIFAEDHRIYIFDLYNNDIYPNDLMAKKYIDFDFPIHSYTSDSIYLQIIIQELPKIMDQVKPDFIIYNAGTDILEGDPLGVLDISTEGIIKRDEIVFQNAMERRIPILMVLSGGYTNRSGYIIGKSITNILINVLKI
jgi:histone deacetylase 11